MANRLVGREIALAALAEAMAGHPVVWLVGPGGIGKTRLAREWLARSTAGARFVSLADVVSLIDVVQEVAIALGASIQGARSAAQALQLTSEALLRSGSALVLDNVEQLRPEVLAAIVEALSTRAGLLLTTRVEPQGAECVLRVERLSAREARDLFDDRVPVEIVPDHQAGAPAAGFPAPADPRRWRRRVRTVRRGPSVRPRPATHRRA